MSSSSSSSSESSSSSLGCCIYPYCEGLGCSHFSSWQFTGMNLGNTNACGLYVIFDGFGTYQQVEIYVDLTYDHLVAIGQRTGSGTILLEERNGSGLTGSVVWDEVEVVFDSAVLVQVEESSYSTSSSLSSIDSSSSSSDVSSESSETF